VDIDLVFHVVSHQCTKLNRNMSDNINIYHSKKYEVFVRPSDRYYQRILPKSVFGSFLLYMFSSVRNY
jgi:hypothetical protein